MSGLRKLQAAWPLVLALLAAGAAARAQETPVATEAREEVWKYEDKGRRDPFTFVKVDTVVKPPTGPTPGVITDQPVIDKIRESARKSYTLAEQAFMNSDSRNAMALADQGLEAINKAKVPLSELPDLQDLQERLFRLRLASERIFNREEAEIAFRNLNITVTGVVAKDRNSRAIVNSHVVGRGDLVDTGGDTTAVIVDQILPGQVVVRFRGFRMKLLVAQ